MGEALKIIEDSRKALQDRCLAFDIPLGQRALCETILDVGQAICVALEAAARER